MSSERISLNDQTLISSYAESIQRYEFALKYCTDKRVLDAGCGTGYGAHFLAANGVRSVLGLDISDEAITEAKDNYRLNNLHFERRDVETLADDPPLGGQFDVVVNFENLAHLQHPERMIGAVAKLLPKGGTLITSTPNGEVSALDENGKPLYRFHYRVYTASDLRSFLSPHFNRLSMYGQWLTHEGMLRRLRAKELFAQLCEAYYNPMARAGRVIKRMVGKSAAGPPKFTGAADSYTGDYVIQPLESGDFRWAPTVLIAVCET